MKKLVLFAAISLIMVSNVMSAPLTQNNASQTESDAKIVTNNPTNVVDKSESEDDDLNVEDVFEGESLAGDDDLPVYTTDDEEEDNSEENPEKPSNNINTDDQNIYGIKDFNDKSKDDDSEDHEEEEDDEENEE